AALLSLERGPRGLGAGFAGSRRESVDERRTEDAELPLERILEHAMYRAARLLELVLDTHWGILPSLIRTAFAERAVPSLQPRGINGREISYSFRDESDSPVESAPRTSKRGIRGTVSAPRSAAASPAPPASPPPPPASRASEADQ